MEKQWQNALVGIFDGLDGPHLEKKKATILAIVDARLSGQAEERVFERPDTCSRTVWHTKWKRDAEIGGRAERIFQAASEWRDNRTLLALAEAVETLQLSAPDAVNRLVAIMNQAADLTNSRLAAVAVLDRAGTSTASKSSVDVDMSTLSDAELQAIIGGKGKG